MALDYLPTGPGAEGRHGRPFRTADVDATQRDAHDASGLSTSSMRHGSTTRGSPPRVPRTIRAAHPEWAFIPNATFMAGSLDSRSGYAFSV